MLVYWRVTFTLRTDPNLVGQATQGCISYNLGEKSAVELVPVFLPHVLYYLGIFILMKQGDFAKNFV